MPKFVSSFKALIDNMQWSNKRIEDGEYVITFSFVDEIPEYSDEYDVVSAALKTFRALNDAEEAAARKALKLWDKASGIRFVEDKTGEGDILFGSYDFKKTGDGQFAGFAFFPVEEAESALDGSASLIGGDVFINSSETASTRNDLHLYLHEIGHALGLKHPFEGDTQLKRSEDWVKNTVMSYNGNWSTGQKLGKYDIKAIQFLYGEDDGKRSHKNKSEKIFGDDSDDRFDGKGGNDRIEGRGGADILLGGKGDDRLSGGIGDDSLSGGKGKDKLNGGSGLDILTGGLGNDTFVYSAADNADTITDFVSGSDRIQLTDKALQTLQIFFIDEEALNFDIATRDVDDVLFYDQATGILSTEVFEGGSLVMKTILNLAAGTQLAFSDFIIGG
jgi:Ca2+-binding RTX toxin-like protein